jgi:hypothetical protein
MRTLSSSKEFRAVVLMFALALSAGFAGRVAAQDDQDAGPQNPSTDQAAPPDNQTQAPYANLTEAQLERLVAPIALYPDSLVAQVLAAATFPSQIADAEEFIKAHQGVDPKDLGPEVDQQPWDNAVKALVQFPNVLSNLASNLGWTSELGDAYYNQQQDVMNAVQVMRKRAQKAGNLKSSQQQTVQDDDHGQIEIAPADPQVVYVPAYDPWLVYGYPIAPWPYWVTTPGIWWGGAGIYFGVGFPIAPWFGFGWGWHAWGVNWYGHGIYYGGRPYFARGGDFYDRRGFYGGRGNFGRPGGTYAYHGGNYRGYDAPRGNGGVRSGAFSGYDHGGASRGYSARGQASMGGGFHGGGFGGGGFHGGGGGHR